MATSSSAAAMTNNMINNMGPSSTTTGSANVKETQPVRRRWQIFQKLQIANFNLLFFPDI